MDIKRIENTKLMFNCKKCKYSEICRHRDKIKHAGQSTLTIKDTHYAAKPDMLAEGFEITVKCLNFEVK